jgi:aspartate aminotransferase-like enzyme
VTSKRLDAKHQKSIMKASKSLREARWAIGTMGLPLARVRDIDHAITVLDQLIEKMEQQ